MPTFGPLIFERYEDSIVFGVNREHLGLSIACVRSVRIILFNGTTLSLVPTIIWTILLIMLHCIKNLLPPKRRVFNDIETYSNIELYDFDHQTFVLLLNVITEK